jgi:hypothetical protein
MNGNALAHLARRLTAAGSRRAALQTLAAGGLSALGFPGRHGAADARDRCRRGKLREVANVPKQMEITFHVFKGLTSLVITQSENANTVAPPFTPGTMGPVVVTSTKIDQIQQARAGSGGAPVHTGADHRRR